MPNPASIAYYAFVNYLIEHNSNIKHLDIHARWEDVAEEHRQAFWEIEAIFKEWVYLSKEIDE